MTENETGARVNHFSLELTVMQQGQITFHWSLLQCSKVKFFSGELAVK